MTQAQPNQTTGFSSQIALIAVGSNASSDWGDPLRTVQSAVQHVSAALDRSAQCSGFYATPCFPAGAGPDFVNAAIRIQTSVPPDQVLEILHRIEADAHRVRVQRWGPRTLDLDLIGWGNAIMPDIATYQHWVDLPSEMQRLHAPDTLILPHPRLAERAFVLVPLADVAPDWVHPITRGTVAQMLERCDPADIAAVTLLEKP